VQLVLGLLDRYARVDRLVEAWPRLESAVARVAPIAGRSEVTHRWVAPDRSALLATWSPAPLPATHLEPTDERCTVATGHWSRPPAHLHEALAEAVGSGNVALLGVSPGALEVRTSAAGVEAMFVATGRRYVAISNRAMVAAVAAGEGRIDFDVTALPQFISAGFALSEGTPFRGVIGLSRSTYVRVDRRRFGVGFRTTRRRDDELVVGADDLGPTAAALAAALVAASAPLSAQDGPVQLGLTGGKDSRMLAAALRAADVPFRTHTFGLDGHPDVVVARRVADELGVEHEHRRPALRSDALAEPTMSVDPLGRAVRAVIVGEGLVSAYENLGSPASPYRPDIVLSGVGGELLRGGSARMAKELTPEGARAYIERGFLRDTGVLRPEARDDLRTVLQPWLDRVGDDPARNLDLFYREHKMARWAAAARTAYAVTRNLYQPLFDSDVVELGARTPMEHRLDEQLIFGALQHLAEPLTRLPFADYRWVFERDGPHPALPTGWETRAPVTATTGGTAGAPSFNWRIHYGTDVQARFREVILDPARDADLFQVVDRTATEALLTEHPPREQHLSWYLLTAAVLLSRVWEQPATASSPVTITVPTTTEA
jgi:hypothetical protein